MPSLTGLSLSSAYARATASGLHIVSAEDVITPTPATPATPTATTPTPAPAPAAANSSPPNETAFAVSTSVGTVIAQSPPSGHHVLKGDPVRLTLSR
jgi:beta-lactam-binding protein with PASTA domain